MGFGNMFTIGGTTTHVHDENAGQGGYLANSWPHLCAPAGGISVGTTFFVILGKSQNGTTDGASITESDMQTSLNRTIRVRRTSTRILSNTTTGTSTFAFRDDSADISFTVSVGAGLTGVFTNNGDATVTAGSLICFRGTAAGGGIITLKSFENWFNGSVTQ